MLIRPVIYDPIRSVIRNPLGASIGFYVGQLFANGEQGVWYDPSDFSTLFQDAAGTIPVTAVEQPVGRILDKSGRGNHASQATAAARPVLSARKNLLIKTEILTDAAWAKTAVTVVDDAIIEDGTNAQHNIRQTVTGVATVGGIFTTTADFRQGAGTRNFVLRVSGASGSAYAVFNPSTGAFITSATTGANWSITATPAAAVSTGDGWFTAKVSVTSNETGNVLSMPQLASGTTLIYMGDSTSSVRVRKVQLEHGAIATRYQRVNTATDYDSVGFPHGEKYDGVDDHDIATTGGGGSAGFFYCTALKLGALGVAQILWSDSGTNTGYRVRINTSNQLELAAGNGVAFTASTTVAAVSFGIPALLTAWDDGATLNVQINQGAVSSVARPAVVAGTAGFTEGRDNGAATSHLNGSLFDRVYAKDGGITATERANVQNILATKAGVTLP